MHGVIPPCLAQNFTFAFYTFVLNGNMIGTENGDVTAISIEARLVFAVNLF